MKKTLVLVALLALAGPATSFAQTPAAAAKSPEQQADRRAEHLSQQLGLSPEQKAKVEPILLAQAQELQALRAKYPAGNRQGMGAELKAGQAKYDEQLKAVLSAEQFTKYLQLRDERRENLRERRRAAR